MSLTCRLSLFLSFSLPLSAISAEQEPQHAPLPLLPGPHLFLDDHLIQSSSNLIRRINCPKRDLAQPVVTAKEDRNFQPYVTVLRDPHSNKFRMWYGIPVTAGQSHLAHIESLDGVHWIRPHQVLEDPGRIAFGASVLDEGSDFPDANWRYKFVWYYGGMMLAHSADGLQWTADRAQPVITGINDILHLARDSARNRYIAVFGFPSRPEDGYKGKTQNSREGYRRCVGQSTSSDCLNWTTPRRIIAPDKMDEGITEFYSIGGVVTCGQMLIGLLKVLRDDLACDPGGKVDGLGYTVLAWSHDGENWQRDRSPFFDRNQQPGSWDHAMAWMDYQLPVGGQLFFYYGGYARGHKVDRFTARQIGLVRMKKDRYVAREAESSGILRTRLLSVDASGIAVNADAAQGEVRAQILGEDSKPIRGFTFADCKPVTVDELSAPLRWKQPLSRIKGKLVHLEFFIRRAKLFGFYLEER